MRDSGPECTIARIAQPIGEVCAHLAPHLTKILASWHRMLRSYEPCGKYTSALSGLHFPHRVKGMWEMQPSRWREDSEKQGEELARRGVPLECIAIAVLAYVESCIPYLGPGDARIVAWLCALLSWSRVYQFFLLSGHARQSALALQALNERVNAAERSYQDSSVQLGDAYEKERRRLARDLHDEIGHDLIVLKLYTQIISMDLTKGDLPQVRKKLKESVSLIKHVLGGVRNLVFDLGPAIWNEQGFLPAVRMHARQFASRTGLRVRFEARRLREPVPARYETALYKVLQGALANIAAHACARHVKISLAISRNSVVMTVGDDGKGFNLESKMRSVAHSYGLRAMRDRIELLGGKIQFISSAAQSGAEHNGTTIRCTLPLRKSEAAA
jgi:signal transduction histidine kinase